MKILLTFFVLIFPFTISAQDSHFSLGLEGGPDYADLRGDFDNDLLKGKIYFNAGLSVNYHFNKKWELKSGLFYEVKGAKIDFDFTDNTGTPIGQYESREIFRYLTVPLLLRYSINRKINYFANAGPFISFLTKQSWEIDDIPGIPEVDIDKTEYYKPLDYGVTFGLGISKTICTNWNLSVELRDNLGLANVSDYPEYDDDLLRTNTVSLLFGVTYKFLAKKPKETTND